MNTASISRGSQFFIDANFDRVPGLRRYASL
jgi:hypothetical protein